MSGGPPPHGQVIGLFKVVHKSSSFAGKVAVTLAGEDGTCIFRISDEDAAYFAEGESYQLSATQP